MTRPDLTCIHEPFGDAFYFGPERLSRRYEEDQQARRDSGFEGSTYATVVEGIRRSEGEVSWGRCPGLQTFDFPGYCSLY